MVTVGDPNLRDFTALIMPSEWRERCSKGSLTAERADPNAPWETIIYNYTP